MPATRKNTPTPDPTPTEIQLVQRLFQIAELLVEADPPVESEAQDPTATETSRPDDTPQKHRKPE